MPDHQDCQKEIDTLKRRVHEVEEFERQHMELHTALMEMIEKQERTMKPIADVFSNANGFMNVTISLIKALLLVSAGVGVIWGAIKYLKD